MTAPAIDLAGGTDLGVAAALIASAAIVVTNDTGTSHLAAALGTPSVTLFQASDPARWAPLDRARHRIAGRGLPDAVPGRPQPIAAATPPDVPEVLAEVGRLVRLAA
jgi:ADP-heptose:LPS heptosyltransferase